MGYLDYGRYCWNCDKSFNHSKLLYPVKHKNYQEDDFIADQWKKLQYYLDQAYMFTIFGYSAPTSDAEAISLMTKAWGLNSIQDFAWIDIVDIKGKRELVKTWGKFQSRFSLFHKKIFETYLFSHPRRSCEALQMATLQQDPWPDNKFPKPKFKTLKELHKWIEPLIKEEQTDQLLSSYGNSQ